MNNAPKKNKQVNKAAAELKSAAKALAKSERKETKRRNREKVGGAAAALKLGPQAAAIAGSIITPDAFPACRLQDGYDNMPTALFEPKVVFEIPFAAGTGLDNAGYPLAEQWLFAFRDPRRGVIVPVHTHGSWQYLLTQGGSSSITGIAGAPIAFDGTVVFSGGFLIDDGYIPLGLAAEGNGGFFPICYNDTVVQRTTGGLPGSTLITMTVDLCDGDENQLGVTWTATSGPGGECTWTFTNANLSVALPTPGGSWFGYCRIRTVNYPCTNAVFALAPANLNFFPVHISLGNFLTVQGMIDEFRANGLSLMYTNTVQEINRSGDVCAYQVPKGVSWPSLVRAGFAAMTKRPGAVTLRADKGIQISWKPSAPKDMQFIDVGQSTTDSEFYPIIPESDYLAICINIPLEAGRGGVCQVHCNAEGRTSSPWFAQIVDSSGSREATQQAFDMVRSYPQVHENPLHVKDAIAFLRRNKKGIGAIASALGAAVPGLAPLASVIGGAASQL